MLGSVIIIFTIFPRGPVVFGIFKMNVARDFVYQLPVGWAVIFSRLFIRFNEANEVRLSALREFSRGIKMNRGLRPKTPEKTHGIMHQKCIYTGSELFYRFFTIMYDSSRFKVARLKIVCSITVDVFFTDSPH